LRAPLRAAASEETNPWPESWSPDGQTLSKQLRIADLKARLSEYLRAVRAGESIAVLDRDTPVAQLIPVGELRALRVRKPAPGSLPPHRTFSIATGVQVYFCDPRSPWQRGTNESANGLARQYLLKGTDLAGYSQDALDAIALRPNTRPRKTLGYRTPAATRAETVASTG